MPPFQLRVQLPCCVFQLCVSFSSQHPQHPPSCLDLGNTWTIQDDWAISCLSLRFFSFSSSSSLSSLFELGFTVRPDPGQPPDPPTSVVVELKVCAPMPRYFIISEVFLLSSELIFTCSSDQTRDIYFYGPLFRLFLQKERGQIFLRLKKVEH